MGFDRHSIQQCRGSYSREVGNGEKGIGVEDVGLEEPLKQVPRHWVTQGSKRRLGTAGGSSSRVYKEREEEDFGDRRVGVS